MEIVEQQKGLLPDFVELKQRFEAMNSGPKAELRRVRSVDMLADLPAYYHWLQGRSDPRFQRIAFFLPHIGHKEGSLPLGQQLKKAGISEMRLFQVIRSEAPRDLEQLRRLVMQLDSKIDWGDFGKTLYYWGRPNKQRILEQYFTPIKKAQ